MSGVLGIEGVLSLSFPAKEVIPSHLRTRSTPAWLVKSKIGGPSSPSGKGGGNFLEGAKPLPNACLNALIISFLLALASGHPGRYSGYPSTDTQRLAGDEAAPL